MVGYTQKLPILANYLQDDILNYSKVWQQIDEQLFQDCKEKLLRDLQSCK